MCKKCKMWKLAVWSKPTDIASYASYKKFVVAVNHPALAKHWEGRANNPVHWYRSKTVYRLADPVGDKLIEQTRPIRKGEKHDQPVSV